MKYSRIVLAALVVLLASVVSSQAQATGYDLQIYAVGAPAPQTVSPLSLADIVCNLAPPAGTSTVNPTRVLWDDPANVGKVCIWTPSVVAGSPLVVLPNGSYEGTVTVTDAAGTSAPSNRAPFSKAPVPAARTGVKLYR